MWQALEWVTGKRLTPTERLNKNIRTLQKTTNDLVKEQGKMTNQEKTLEAAIRKSATAGQMGACKIQAKDLIRTRQNKERFVNMAMRIRAITMQLMIIKANGQMVTSMTNATSILGKMNGSLNLPQLQRMAMEFEKQLDMMDQRQEIVADAMDEATGVDDEEAEDEIVDRVVEEIRFGQKQSMGDTPQGLQTSAVAENQVAQAIGGDGADPGDDDLQARLNGLRR